MYTTARSFAWSERSRTARIGFTRACVWQKERRSNRKKHNMIDPISALAAIQAAVALVKKVSKTVDDVASLGPVLGKYFDAKSNATKAAVHAKNSGNKSSMGTAIEIEMAIMQAEQFERELQMLFMTCGKVDVWNKIKNRAAAMDADAAHEVRRAKEAAQRRKREIDDAIEMGLAVVLIIVLVVGTLWGSYEFIQYCAQVRCGR